MAESQATEKKKTEVEQVVMSDGRTVGFPGKRKLQKEVILDQSKIVADADTVTLQDGAISIRLDLRHGATRLFAIPAKMVADFAGHGGLQKFGDELATTSDKPLSDEDAEMALDDLYGRIQKGEWTAERAAGSGFSGASDVVRAIMEHTGKGQEEVKAFLQKKLDDAKARGETLSRPALYSSFRSSKALGPIIKRLEEERAAKQGGGSKVDADAALAELV